MHFISTPAHRQQSQALYEAALLQWKRHPSYRSSWMTHHLVEEVHMHFRVMFRRVLARSAVKGSLDIAAFQDAWRSLHGHHTTEDEWLFPKMVRDMPDLKAQFDFLEEDHKYLHPLRERIVRDKDGAALEKLVAFLDDHLNREEMIVVPIF